MKKQIIFTIAGLSLFASSASFAGALRFDCGNMLPPGGPVAGAKQYSVEIQTPGIIKVSLIESNLGHDSPPIEMQRVASLPERPRFAWQGFEVEVSRDNPSNMLDKVSMSYNKGQPVVCKKAIPK